MSRSRRAIAQFSVVILGSAVAACATNHARIALPNATPSLACRIPIEPGGARAAEAIAWTVPSGERQALDAWCGTTGPPVIAPRPARPSDASGALNELVVVTWNVHVGSADVVEFVQRLRAGALTNGHPAERFVLLLQEAFRADQIVPRTPVDGVHPPPARRGGGAKRVDVVRLAQSLGLALYYVPSMRNGTAEETDEDRGNAILSTEPLSEFSAIELPFERQRRVAIAATISGRDSAGWTLRVANAHFESSVRASRLWILAMAPRRQQARSLLGSLDLNGPLVLGGDLNSWFGFFEPAYRTVAAAIPDIGRHDWHPTYAPFFRLDHLFSRLPDGWTVTAARVGDRLGSDHFPIVASFQLLRDEGPLGVRKVRVD